MHYITIIIIETKKQPASQKQNVDIDPEHRKTKWATFTYSGKETRKITKLFKDTQIKIVLKTRNVIQNILKNIREKTNTASVAYTK
jgi:hypothetical protein